MYPIPEAFQAHMVELAGARGAAWVAALPGQIAHWAAHWSLTLGPPFALSYNYAAPGARDDGMAVVLKMGLPGDELRTEIEALRLYDGQGSVRLLDADADAGVLLLERLLPGTMLSETADDGAATELAAEVMRALWRPVPADHAFPTVADWASGLQELRARFAGGTGPLPAALVAKAEGLFADLLPSQADAVLLHGDLHHFNILAAARAPWLAIDPKGVVGEPAYEIGAFLRNPDLDALSAAELARTEARRIAQFADILGLDRARLAAWGYAQAVLSAWWSLEDEGHGWEGAIRVAEALALLV